MLTATGSLSASDWLKNVSNGNKIEMNAITKNRVWNDELERKADSVDIDVKIGIVNNNVETGTEAFEIRMDSEVVNSDNEPNFRNSRFRSFLECSNR